MNAFESDSLVFGWGMPGAGELVIILLIVLVVFGHKRIPQLGEALGKGIRNFKKSFSSDQTEAEASKVEVRQGSEQAPASQAQPAEKTEDAEVS